MGKFANEARHHFGEIERYYHHAGFTGYSQALHHYHELTGLMRRAYGSRDAQNDMVVIRSLVERAGLLMEEMKRRHDEHTKQPTCDTWYFAYGSNLSVDQKEDRTLKIRQAIRCRLPAHRFAFNKRCDDGRICANIVRDDATEVWGVVYLCDSTAIRTMDRWEGVARGDYERLPVRVLNDMNEIIEAVTYVAGADFVCEPGQPSSDYLALILRGARHHGLPDSYIEQIELLARE
ncbi:MAG: gamma-glutamylcyclotransferase [Pirellulales bacterium]